VSRTAARGWARFTILVLRSLAAVCFALVLLGLPDRTPFAGPRYALVLDDTPSVRLAFPGFVEEAVTLWQGFQGGRHPVVGVGEHPRPAGGPGVAPRFTDLPAALRSAAEIGPPGVETRILLVTDGLSREGALEDTVRSLRERGASVWTLAPPQPAPLARAVEVVLPERVFPGEPFTVRGRILSSRPGTVVAQLLRNGEAVAETTVTIEASGIGDAEFVQEADRVGRTRYAIGVAGSPAAVGEVSVAQSPRVLWLSEDAGAAGPLVGLLREAGVEVELAHPADLAAPTQDLARAEVIVLDDLSGPALADGLVEGLRQAVGARGAGLVVLGGRRGLGSGEYAGAPIEAMLPVTTGFRSPPPPERIAMVLALDTSFSMAYRGRGVPSSHGTDPRKIDVARESAKEVVRIVRPGDRLGVLGNSTDIFWVVPLGEVTDPAGAVERIDALRPLGDGIYFYSVLHEAREALRREAGGVRHVLVLCDAEDIDQYEVEGRGHSFDLVRSMAEEGLTVSILAIGRSTDKDVPFLRTAALLGRGDFYLVPRIVALPRYFVSEYRRISSVRHYLEEEIRPVASDHSATRAEGTYPPLAGVALVTAREGGRTLLQTTLGAPLLVGGEYGRGRTVVFAGDNGHRWAASWVGAGGMRRFWLQLLFGAAPPGERARGFASYLEADRRTGRLRFHYAGSEAGLPPWDVLWALQAGGEAGGPLRLDRVGLRSFRAAVPFGTEGFRRVLIAEDREGARPLLVTGSPVPPAEEEVPAPPRWALVEHLHKGTGGGWVGRPEELVPAGGAARAPVPWALLFIAAGVAFLTAEAVIRSYKED